MPRRVGRYLHEWYNTMTNRGYIVQLMLLIVLILLLFFLVQARNSNERLLEIAEQNARIHSGNQDILKEVQSCTTPDGACARRGSQSSARAIETVNKVSIYAAYCASVIPAPVNADAVKECVQKNLAAENNREGR